MSLTSCLRKAGDSLNRDDRAAVLRLSRQYRSEGMAADPAALRAIDEVIAAAEEQLKAAMASAKGEKTQAPAASPPATPPKPRRERAEPSAATVKAKADLMAALGDLGDLLNFKAGGRAYAVPPDMESKLLPILTRVFDAAFRLGYHSFKDAAKFALDQIRENLSAEVADAITLDHMQGAYIAMAGGKEGADSKRSVIDVESKAEIEQHVIDEEQGNASSGNPDLERDRSGATGQPAAGPGVPGQDDAGAVQGAGGRAGAGGRRAGVGSRAAGTPDGGPVAGGKRVNQRVDGGKRPAGPAPGDPGADFDDRGGAAGNIGVQPEPDGSQGAGQGAEQVRSESERLAAQRLVDERVARGELKVRLADRASIDETLPYLLPAQREDVYKAELQHAKPDGYGMLFTNGTGTGKTFSGLGIIKRRQLLGQTDQLIAVPDNKIAADWVESGQRLGLSISQLEDTKSAGEGIVITTYANLGENDELAKRKWQHVVPDEAHSLMQSADGVVTSYLEHLRALTYHPEGERAAWMMRHRELHNELESLTRSIEGNNRIISNPDTMDAMVAALREENKKLQQRAAAIAADLGAKRRAIAEEWTKNQREARTRATFLSATPFAYHTSLEWAQGYLFDYKEGYPYELDGSRPYNQPNPKQYFFMTHLGYRMRYNKLTKPDGAKVDVGMMERQLNSWMKRQGSLSGRMLEVEPDYDRRFVLIDSNIGNKIDEAIEYLREQSNQQYQRNREKKLDEPKEHGWGALEHKINDQFDYLSRRYLLEAIKARESIPIVREHMKMGRRVVVFHDYKKGSGNNPFDVPEARQPKPADFDKLADPQGEFEEAKAKVDGYNAARAQFRRQFPELFTELVQLKPPIDAYREAFAEGTELLVINGDEKPKEVLKRYTQFQNDDGGPLVALVQSDKNKGWSGHDTTGKHQRVLLNLGLPTAPTKLIQLEGRIYRTGVVSDAILRNLNTGTNWERWAFANTIASRASTAENLSMGELSRALRDSIIASFENADLFPPGHDGEGKGGKKMDRAANNILSDFDRAKTFYWATGKKTSRNKSEEGKDYFATPEPLGLKMVEWADVRSGEDVLEPSAGHGAIARWFPELANRTAIEPAPVLMSRLGMAMNPAKDRLVDGTFEDHDIVNKYDAIVMNPPFGVGGKQALEHVAKAARHLRDGGRIVALIPSGPAADKRLEQFLYGKEERPVKELGELRGPSGIKTPIYRGDRIESRASWARSGVVTGLGTDGKTVQVHVDGTASGMTTAITVESITKVEPTGKRSAEFSPSEGLQLVADVKLPSVTFERAGTAVWAHIIVLEKTKDDVGTTKQVDLSGIEDINQLFDRIEKMGLRPRAKPVPGEQDAAPAQGAPAAAAAAPAAPVATVVRAEGETIIEHTTAKGKVIRGIVRKGITREQAQKIDAYTFPKNGGFFIREKYLVDNSAREPEPDYGPGQYDTDLFGNAIPRPAPEADKPKRAPKQRQKVYQQALDLEGGDVNPDLLSAPPAPPPRRMDPELYVDTVLFKATERELGTDRAKTAAEAAVATSYLARGAVERLDILVTDKDHRPVAVVGNFKGDRAEASGYPFTVVAEVLQIEGAKHLWVSHNHPSGNAILSAADIRLARTYERSLEHTGITVHGVIAVTHTGKYAAWNTEDGMNDLSALADQAIPPAAGSPIAVPVLERELRDERIAPLMLDSPMKAREFAQAFYLRSNGPGIILLDAGYKIAGWIPVGPDMHTLRTGSGMRRLLQAATQANTTAAVMVHGGELDARIGGANGAPVWLNLVNAITRAHIRALDVVDVKAKTSAASMGANLQGGGELFALDKGSIWRSELEDQVSKATMKQAPAAQWLAFINGLTKKGVKPAEIEWSGVADWLKMLGDTKVAREEVLLYLGTNGVKVSEVMRGGMSASAELDTLNVELDALGWTFDRRRFEDGDEYTGRDVVLTERATGHEFKWDRASRTLVSVDSRLGIDPITNDTNEGVIVLGLASKIDDLAELERDGATDDDGTRYSKYTLPGGENYRELLITAPLPELTTEQLTAGFVPLTELPPDYENIFDSSQEPGQQWGITPPGQQHARPWAGRWPSPEVARAEALKKLNQLRAADHRDKVLNERDRKKFVSNHWDEDNILAHVRMKDRTAPRADMADIEQRIVKAVGAKGGESLGNGAPQVAVRKGAITEQEGRWYSQHRGFLNVPAENPNERVLFIEEVQSDWAQQGRKHGFVSGPPSPEQIEAAALKNRKASNDTEAAKSLLLLKQQDVRELEAQANKAANILSNHPDEAARRAAADGMWELKEKLVAAGEAVEKARQDWLRAQALERQASTEEYNLRNPKDVAPRGPFVESTDAWVALVAKRIIHYAASNGYDRVAFVNGKQSVDRYRLSKVVDGVSWFTAHERTDKVVSLQMRGNNSDIDLIVDDRGIVRGGSNAAGSRLGANGKALSDLIGRELAEKVLGKEKGELRDVDLDIGGRGMRDFYDKVLPSVFNRILPKFGGAKLEPVKVSFERDSGGISGDEVMASMGIEADRRRQYWGDLEQDERDRLIEQHRDRMAGEPREQPGFSITPEMKKAVMDGMPLFSRPRMTTQEVREQLAAARGMAVPRVEAIVRRITAGWAGGIEVKVVPTARDLPGGNAPADAKGLYLNGVGYVVAARVKNDRDVGQIIAHELVQHHGVRNSLGQDSWQRLMKQIQAAADAGNTEIAAAREYVRNAYRTADGKYMLTEGGTIEADEVAARLIEQSVDARGNVRPKLAFLKWVWAKLADFLRGLGMKVPFTMPELHGIWVQAVSDLRAGRGTAAGDLAMAARDTRQIQVGGKWRPIENSEGQPIAREFGQQQAFWKWFGDSKVVDDEGRPLVVYHGARGLPDNTSFSVFMRSSAGYIYATRAKDYASSFGAGGSVYPLYLSMKKPLDMREFKENDVQGGALWELLQRNGINTEGLDLAKTPGPAWAWIKHPGMKERIQAAGFDGIMVIEGVVSEHPNGIEAYVAFEPTQLKSTFNRGAFNPQDPDILYAIDIAGGAARAYTPEQMAAMRNVGFARELPPLKDKLKAMWKDAGKRLAQGIVDQFAPIKDISKEAYGLLRLSKGASGAFEVLLHGGLLKLNAGVYDFDEKQRGGAVERLLLPLQGEHHDFLRWVAANRAEQLMAEDRERLFTADDIRALKTLSDGTLDFDYKLAHGPKAGKTTRSRAEAYADSLVTFNEFNKNTLDMAEQSGLIDKEGRALWEKEFYVPFYRVEDEGGIRGMNIKSGVVRQQAFKHLKGGAQQLNMDLLENTLMNWAHLLDAAAKNRAAKATLEAMQNLGSAVEAPEDVVRQMAKSLSKRNNVVWFMDEGRRRHFLIDDPYLLAAVSALEFSGFNSPVMQALGTAKRWLTVGVTASPFFKVRNLIRDTVQAIGTSPLGANPLANLREGAAVVGKGALSGRNTDEWYRLLAGGGTIHFGTMLEGSEAKRVQALVESGVDRSTILDSGDRVQAFYRKTVEPLITAYNELGNRGEAINRAALYQQLRKQGVSHAEASLQARDLMDFSMQGSFTTVRFLTQVVPFMNARLQGMYKLGRAFNEDPARLSMVVMATSVLSIGLLAAYGDDDDWKKREDWDRNNYWWFKAGGIAYRIPKPFEIGAVATLAERTWELAFEQEMTNTRFRAQVVALLGDQLALNPVPQLVRPIIDLYANKDSFTDRPIETMGMEKLQPQLRYREDTSMLARGASSVLSAAGRAVGVEGLSPVQIDHAIRGYFGWLGTMAVSATDVFARPATSQPAQPAPDWWKVLTGSIASKMEDAPSRYVSQVYEQAKALEQVYGTWRYLVREGRIEEAQAFRDEYAEELVRYRQAEAVKRAMTSINQLKRRVEEGSGTPEEKREQLRELNGRADAIARRLAPV